MSLDERFASKYFVAPDGCWLWTASVNWKNYGMLGHNGKVKKAHRVSYELYVGTIPEGMHIDHLCRQRSCVNPYHLELVTPGENVRRGTRTKIVCEHGVGHTSCKLGCRKKLG